MALPQRLGNRGVPMQMHWKVHSADAGAGGERKRDNYQGRAGQTGARTKVARKAREGRSDTVLTGWHGEEGRNTER